MTRIKVIFLHLIIILKYPLMTQSDDSGLFFIPLDYEFAGQIENVHIEFSVLTINTVIWFLSSSFGS